MNRKALLGILATGLFVCLASAQSVTTLASGGLLEPHSVVIGNDGKYYLTDRALHAVLKFDPITSNIELIAGSPTGEDGSANGNSVSARFLAPSGILSTRGGYVVADSGNHVIRFVSSAGDVTTLAGSATLFGFVNSADPTLARFRFPTGLALDAAGNIFVADSLNHAIRKIDPANVVTTIAIGFNQPNGISAGANDTLWVADTRNNQIKLISSVTGALMATIGSGNVGSANSVIPTLTEFNRPRNLVVLSGAGGVLIADTGNNLIRRVTTNSALMTLSTETVAGLAGVAGRVDGTTNTATFNAPIGLLSDPESGILAVVDSSGSAAEGGALRTIQLTAPLESIQQTTLGYLRRATNNTTGSVFTQFIEVEDGSFANFVHIAVKGDENVITTVTSGASPTDGITDTVPAPTENNTSVIHYLDTFDFTPIIIAQFLPDLTVKARSFSSGRPPSGVSTARFKFIASTPIINGDNALSFTLGNFTTDAQMFYTIDGTTPPETEQEAINNANVVGPFTSGAILTLDFGAADTLDFRARAYAQNMTQSGIATRQFSKTGFSANKITFGFDSGEGSSQFLAAQGQLFLAPITMDLLPDGRTMEGLQFSLGVTNLNPAGPAVTGAIEYRTMLQAIIPNTAPPAFTDISPAFALAGGVAFQDPAFLTNLVISNFNGGINFLTVGYLERAGIGSINLYNSEEQNLISFSQAHNNQFLGSAGKVIVGAFGVRIPAMALVGDKYRIALSRPSAVVNVDEDVFLLAPKDGVLGAGSPANAVKELTVGNPGYIVGDVVPFGWFNAGDFGDTNILANDLMQVFQTATYSYNSPPAGSDFFDAMDSSDGTAQTFNGLDNAAIDGITVGDGNLQVDDVFVTFRRALDPTLKWYRRFWTNGARTSVEFPNQFRGVVNGPIANLAAKPLAPTPQANTPAAPLTSDSPFVQFTAGDATSAPGVGQIQIPIHAKVKGNYPLRVLLMNLYVHPVDGSPSVTAPVRFVPGDLGAPTLSNQDRPNNIAGVWLDASVQGVTGNALVGNLIVTLPEGADSNSAYVIGFDRVSGSPNGYGILNKAVADGLITLSPRTGSSLGDNIPDSWRLRYFGEIGNLLSLASADADGDGVSNWDEFRAGTHPNRSDSMLKLLTNPEAGDASTGVTLRWPTVDGKRYVVECSTSLFDGEWNEVSSTIDGDGDVETFTDQGNGSQPRFYRVKVVEN
jgi:hypothetical protein